ncbi:MAG: hypothetical protein LQ340_003520 [Diploschistes diacapsis]|nr:MAG: hypothetical protein LQ340_003520 [Diploschistes diacapsis]
MAPKKRHDAPENRKQNPKIHKAVSLFTILCWMGSIAYATYVVIAHLAINYLLFPMGTLPRNTATAAVILALYFAFMTMMMACYLRLAVTLGMEPGYMPLGSRFTQMKKKRYADPEKRAAFQHPNGPENLQNNTSSLTTPYPPCLTASIAQSRIRGSFGYISRHRDIAASQLRAMTQRDYYLCQENGYPPWCEHCFNWKEDRAHHCSEMNRCVRRMDHYCPWVGGMVSEAGFKFFIQFTGWAGVYCLYLLIITSVFFADMNRHEIPVNRNIITVLPLAGLFGVFCFGMFGTSIPLLARNLTTVEDIDSKAKVWTLALRVPEGFPLESLAPGVRAITWPSNPPQSYAILYTRKGENPFDIGRKENVSEVMGSSLWNWLLPFSRSPVTIHRSIEQGWYPINKKMHARLQKEAGLVV